MNFLQKVARWAFQKAVGFPPWNAAGPWPQAVISAYSGGFGAMQLSTVYGCVRVRGQTLGSLPCKVYRIDKDEQKTLLPDHWLWPLIHDSPNAYQTHFEFFELMERSFCLYGNAYAEKARLGRRIVALNFLNPDFVNVRWDQTKKSIVYTYSFMGNYSEYGPDEILHVKNFSSNGLWGDSPIRSHAINHAMEAEDYGRFFLQNLGRPAGYLKFKGKRPANEETNNKLRADWQAIHGGPQNAGKTGVLWEEGEYIPLSISPDDAQYIETRKLSREEIAGAIYGVPLSLIGQTDKPSYASAEQFDIDFTKHTVRPQARRFEEAIKKALLSAEPDVIVEMDLEELQRGDMQAIATYTSSVVQNGIASRNEVRPKFGLPKRAGADELTVQVNQTPLDQLGKVQAQAQPANPPSNAPQNNNPGGKQ